MKQRQALAWVLTAGAAVAFPFGCITINLHFPERELEDAAEEIVDEVRPDIAEAPTEEETPAEGAVAPGTKPVRVQSSTTGTMGASFFGLSSAWAAGASAEEEENGKIKINVGTPRIKAIKKTLKARYPKLLRFYRKNAVGEGRDGNLVHRDVGALNLKEKRDLKLLVTAENKDRKELYTAIAKENSIDNKMVVQIGKLFASQWQKKCKTGWWIQDEKGKWSKKKPPKKKPAA